MIRSPSTLGCPLDGWPRTSGDDPMKTRNDYRIAALAPHERG